MSAAGYASFLEAIGHQVKEHAGVYWFDSHPRIYMSFPFQTLVDPGEIDLRTILGSDGLVLRFPCAIEQGRKSFRIAVDDVNYDLSSLSGKARNQTRRGLEKCTVTPLGFDELIHGGIQLNRETIVRQGRKIPEDFDKYWINYYKAAECADGAEAWGAFIDNELAAYLIAFRMDGVAHILIMRSAVSMLKYYPNNALLFKYIQSGLNDRSVREVSIGLESIQSGMESLDRFKTGMGFRQIPVGQYVAFRPWLDRIITSPIGRVVGWYANNHQENERIAKLSGLIRWHREQAS